MNRLTARQWIFTVLCFLTAVSGTILMAGTAKAAEKECVIMSKDKLLIGIESYVKRAIIIPDDLRDAYFKKLNKLRKVNGVFEIVTDEMIIFETKNDMYGIEIFYEGCVLPFVAQLLPKQGMEMFFHLHGESDIVKFVEDTDA